MSTKKNFIAVRDTAGKAWRELSADPEWENITIEMDEETGYPEIGEDIIRLLSQYEPHSVVSAVKATHANREPMQQAKDKSVKQLLKSDQSPEAEETYNDLAARLAKNVDIPDGQHEEGDRRELARRKQLFMIFRQMLKDLRLQEIQHNAFDGDKNFSVSAGFKEVSQQIDAATNAEKDLTENLEDAPLTGAEDKQNVADIKQEIGAKMISGQGVDEPPTDAFMPRGEGEAAQEEHADEVTKAAMAAEAGEGEGEGEEDEEDEEEVEEEGGEEAVPNPPPVMPSQPVPSMEMISSLLRGFMRQQEANFAMFRREMKRQRDEEELYRELKDMHRKLIKLTNDKRLS